MKPKIPIVDKNDNIIDYKYREEILPTDIYRVSALWITNNKGDVLLAQRAFNKSHDPGKYGPAVAGTVDEGETYEQNIIREAYEELGIKGIVFKLGPKVKRGGKHLHFTQWFTCVINEPISYFTIQKNEVAAIKWIPIKNLINDLKINPQKYLISTPEWVKLFTL
ncbi:MAG: NUDIX domain-containing protein [Patescibacteria group bacterium]